MDETYSNSLPVRKERKRKEHAQRGRQRGRKDELFGNESTANLIWSNQSIVPPQRMMGNGDASYTPYPVHVSYPLDPFQFSLYPSVYPMAPPAQFCPVPPVRKARKDASLEHPNKKLEPKPVSQLPHQQYASLPPVNCEPFSPKSTDSDSNSKRHFSDPGPASTDDSDDSYSSIFNPMYMNLQEEVRDLREKSRRLTQDLSATKQELLDIKMMGCSKCLSPDLQPGCITDAIGEMRLALQTREQSIFDKVQSQLSASSDHQNQKLSAFTERLKTLEGKLAQFESRQTKDVSVSTDQVPEASDDDQLVKATQQSLVCVKLEATAAPDAFNKVRLLEEEKTKLEVELQKAVSDRTEAEANTHRLERLVSILRQKINGLSEDSCLPEETQARPIILPFLNACDHNLNKVSEELKSKEIMSIQSNVKLNGNAPNMRQLQPPNIPPRPNVFSPPSRPKTSPPNRPSSIPAVVNFSIGQPVSAKVESQVESGTSSELSSEATSLGPESFGGTITISGPVTDL